MLALFFCARAGKMLIPGCVRDLVRLPGPVLETDAVILGAVTVVFDLI